MADRFPLATRLLLLLTTIACIVSAACAIRDLILVYSGMDGQSLSLDRDGVDLAWIRTPPAAPQQPEANSPLIQRPVFYPSRRWQVEETARPAKQAPTPRPKGNMVGFLAQGGDIVALVHEEGASEFVELRVGSKWQGWLVKRVNKQEVVLELDGVEINLR